MATGSRIKGITIELDGNTTGLEKSLSDVTKKSIDIQKELKDIDRLLKFDPGNVTALSQKQKLLSQQVINTTEKLNRLKDAESQVEAQFQRGQLGENQYRAFRREIEFTEREINKLNQSIRSIGEGANITSIASDLDRVSQAANNAEESTQSLGDRLDNVAAGIAAGAGLGEVIEKALDVTSTQTKIDISMELDPQNLEVVKSAISNIEAYGVDAGDALEGVRRQWALNKDASDESNAAVVKGAAAIVASYGEVDFTELIQQTNSLSKNLGISNEDAMALTYSLLKMGFPPDQLDVITEYGTQLKSAGYNAKEIQGIMAAGVKTGTWNIDVLLDGLKEGRITLAEFGNGVDKATTQLLQGTSISAAQLQKWGKDVASGGDAGKKAMQDVAGAVAGITDKTKQNQVGVAIYGTLWEENGTKITDTILNMNQNMVTAEANQNNLNGAIMSLDADPMVQLKTATNDLMTALTPLLVMVADLVAKIATWISENPTLTATIISIVSAVGIFLGIVSGLAPIITMLVSIFPVLAGAIAAMAGPVTVIVAVIAALIAAGIALYMNWDWVQAKAGEVWEFIKASVSSFVDSLVNFFTVTIPETLNNMVQFFIDLPNKIANALMFVIAKLAEWGTAILNYITTNVPIWIDNVVNFFLGLPDKIAYALGFVAGKIYEWGVNVGNYLVTNVPIWINNVVTFFSQLPGKIWAWLVATASRVYTWGINIGNYLRTNIPILINNVVTFFSELPGKIWTWLVNVVNKIREWGSNMLTTAKTKTNEVINGIVDTFKSLPDKMWDVGINAVAGLKNGFLNAWEGMKGWVGGLVNKFTQGATDALDEGSPSKVMEKIGAFAGEGFAIGVKSSLGLVSEQATAMANAINPMQAINSPSFTNPNTNTFTTGDTVLFAQIPVSLDGKIIADKTTPLVVSNISRSQLNRNISLGRGY